MTNTYTVPQTPYAVAFINNAYVLVSTTTGNIITQQGNIQNGN